jgi:O-antigen/teichoic acid export membrane protein
LPPAALGLYVVSVAFTNLTRFIGHSVGMIAAPHIASQRDRRQQLRAIRRFFAISSAMCGAVTIVLIFSVGLLIPLLFGDEFRGAVGISRILLLSSFFLGIRRVLTDAARGFGLPAIGSVAEVASLVWFIPAALLLKPALGLEGVAWAYASASIAGFLVLALNFYAKRNSHFGATAGP